MPSFLPDIPLENFIAICRGLELVRFEPGETVVSLGEVPDAWYFIVSGTLDVFRNDEDAKLDKLASKNSAATLEKWLFSNAKRRTATITSDKRSAALCLK